jgi:hypothetical protein
MDVPSEFTTRRRDAGATRPIAMTRPRSEEEEDAVVALDDGVHSGAD